MTFNQLWDKYTLEYYNKLDRTTRSRVAVVAHQESCNREFAEFWFNEGKKSRENAKVRK